jgi:hypothetical protein
MNFLPKCIEAIATEADAIRALRPGGPFDRTLCRTKCLQCSKEVNELLRWFYNCDGRCACGGQFDSAPLWKAAMQQLTNYLALTDSSDAGEDDNNQ